MSPPLEPAGPLDLVLVTRVVDFAALKHRGQRRKGAAGEPYFNHLAEVAFLVAKATEGRDPLAVLGALLHDTIEDTETTADELEAEFGADVARLVAEVTDDKRLPKAERKRLQVETAPEKSRQARMLKIADKTSNLRAMAMSPPMGWDLERRNDYIDWAEAVVAGCRGLSERLEEGFDDAVRHARAAIRTAR
jgi:(p)ppGpp synthase/HD superfamily hydrolase